MCLLNCHWLWRLLKNWRKRCQINHTGAVLPRHQRGSCMKSSGRVFVTFYYLWSHLCSCSHLECSFGAHLYRYRRRLLLWEDTCFMQCTFQDEQVQFVCSVLWIRTWECWAMLGSAEASLGKQYYSWRALFFHLVRKRRCWYSFCSVDMLNG